MVDMDYSERQKVHEEDEHRGGVFVTDRTTREDASQQEHLVDDNDNIDNDDAFRTNDVTTTSSRIGRRRRAYSVSSAQPTVETVIVKAKKAASNIWILLHAQSCPHVPGQCPHSGCQEAKLLHLHFKTCAAGSVGFACPSQHRGCDQGRQLMAHYRRCRTMRGRITSSAHHHHPPSTILINNNSSSNNSSSSSPQYCLICSMVARQARTVLDRNTSSSNRSLPFLGGSSSSVSSSSSSSPSTSLGVVHKASSTILTKPGQYQANGAVTTFFLTTPTIIGTNNKNRNGRVDRTASPVMMLPPPPRRTLQAALKSDDDLIPNKASSGSLSSSPISLLHTSLSMNDLTSHTAAVQSSLPEQQVTNPNKDDNEWDNKMASLQSATWQQNLDIASPILLQEHSLRHTQTFQQQRHQSQMMFSTPSASPRGFRSTAPMPVIRSLSPKMTNPPSTITTSKPVMLQSSSIIVGGSNHHESLSSVIKTTPTMIGTTCETIYEECSNFSATQPMTVPSSTTSATVGWASSGMSMDIDMSR